MKIDMLKNYPSMNGIEGLFVVDFKIRAFGVQEEIYGFWIGGVDSEEDLVGFRGGVGVNICGLELGFHLFKNVNNIIPKIKEAFTVRLNFIKVWS